MSNPLVTGLQRTHAPATVSDDTNWGRSLGTTYAALSAQPSVFRNNLMRVCHG